MRYSRFSLAVILCMFSASGTWAASKMSLPAADDSDWANYTWPNYQPTPQQFEPDYGTSERYLEATRDVEKTLNTLPSQMRGGVPQQAAPMAPSQPYPQPFYSQNPSQAMAYPPSYSAPSATPYPPTYSPQQAAPMAPQAYPQQYALPPQPYAGQAYNPQGLSAERMQSEQQFNRSSTDYWKLNFGVGLGYMPEFEGSDEHDLIVLPIVDVSYKDTFFINTFLGAGINLYKENGFRAGPFMTVDLGRDSDDATYLAGAEDVDPALESGVFLQKDFDPFSFLWTARYTPFNRGHGGFVSDAELSYRHQLQPGFFGTVSGSTSWASEDYMISYFGVSSAHAARSGLAGYTPDAGFKDIGIAGSLNYILDDQISVIMNMGLKKLLGDAKDSPITKAGDDLQLYGGTGVIYSF